MRLNPDAPLPASSGLRTLTPGELDMAKSVFADTIDYSKVFIKTTNLPRGSKAFHSIIRFSKGDYSKDFTNASLGKRGIFIHELEHLRQEQTGTNLIWAAAGIFFQGGYSKRRGYKYGDVADIQSFSELNIEQKAKLTEDFYETRERLKKITSEKYINENCDFQIDAAKVLRPHLPHIQVSPECATPSV